MTEDNFFSINRLIEFGMGITIAQQMISTMNESMKTMHVPGAMNPMEKIQHNLYYAMIDGKQSGPFSEKELSRLIAEKKVVKETYIWFPNMTNWKMAEQIPEVLRLVALSPPPFENK